MKRLVCRVGLLIILLATGGCTMVDYLDTHRTLAPEPVETPPPVSEPEPVEAPEIISANSYISKAQDYESKGELQQSLYYLRVAAAIDPENSDIKSRIADLERNIRLQAEARFQKGVADYKQGERENAKKEWLRALKTDPGHREALAYLKTKLAAADTVAYTVQAGDTPQKISRKVYHNPHRGIVVSYFSDRKTRQGLRPGVVIDLPVLDPEFIKPPEKQPEPAVDVEAEIAKAKVLLVEKRYADVLLIADKILDYDYLNPDAAGLINAVYFEKGQSYFQEENYSAALAAFEKVDPQYRDTSANISLIKTILHQKAEDHYLKGVKYFINEDLEGAIKEWEITLSLNPDHRKAGSDIQDARNLLEKLGTVEQVPADE